MKDLRDFIKLLRDKGQLVGHRRSGRPGARDHRDRRPGGQGRRSGAAVHPAQGLARSRCSSTSSAATSGCAWLCAPARTTSWRARVQTLASLEVPGGAWEKVKALAQAQGPGRAAAAHRQERPLPGGGADRRRRSTWARCPCCSAGRSTPAATSPCRWSSPGIRVTGRRNVGMYRLQVYDRRHHRHALAHPQGCAPSTTGWRPSGRRRRRGAAAQRRRATGAAAAAWKWRWPSAPTRRSPTRPRRRCPGAIDEMTFAGFLRGEAVDMVQCKTVDLRGAGPRRVRARGLRRPGRSRAAKARSATTPATTRWPTTTRCST